jgi:ssDNA-binding Zn-finger/Zn-ribbon topoisomerase 1
VKKIPRRLDRLSADELKRLAPKKAAVQYPETVDGWIEFAKTKEKHFHKPCPCGGDLIVREDFRTKKPYLGCTQFPKCRREEKVTLEEICGPEATEAYWDWDKKEEDKKREKLDEMFRGIVAANIAWEMNAERASLEYVAKEFRKRNDLAGHC